MHRLMQHGSRRGFTRQPEPKRVHFRPPALRKHHQNSTRRHPERDKKSKHGAGRGKKRAKFWAVRRRGVRRKVGRTHKNRTHNTHNTTNNTHNKQFKNTKKQLTTKFQTKKNKKKTMKKKSKQLTTKIQTIKKTKKNN